MNKSKWIPHHNAKKVENKLQKSDISVVKQSKGPWFLTTDGKFGTLPEMQEHAEIIEYFNQELDGGPTIDGASPISLKEFQVKTGMIRVRPNPDEIDLTIRVLPTNYQLDALQKLENDGGSLNYEIKLADQHNKKGIGFSNLKKDLETLQKEI